MLPIKGILLPGRDSFAAEIYSLLRDAILSGKLLPGERLREEEIGRALSVSRTPVREALQRLERDGLVQRGSRGIIVTDHSADELAELCVVRDAFEGISARLAATNRSETALLVIHEAMEQYARSVHNGELAEIVEANHAFHEAIWQAAQISYLMRQLELLRGLIERIDMTTLEASERQREALDEHVAIFEAIQAQDAVRAEKITLDHFRKGSAIRVMHKSKLLEKGRQAEMESFVELRANARHPS